MERWDTPAAVVARCRGMTGGPLSSQQTFMEPLICAKVCARPGDPETVRPGHSSKEGYRLYKLKELFQSLLVNRVLHRCYFSSLPPALKHTDSLGDSHCWPMVISLTAQPHRCTLSLSPICSTEYMWWPKALRWWIPKSSERLLSRLVGLHLITVQIQEQGAIPLGFLQPLLPAQDPAPDAMGCLVAQPGIPTLGPHLLLFGVIEGNRL